MSQISAPQCIALSVKFLGPSNHRGSRVKASCKRLSLNKTFSYKYEENGAVEQIEAALLRAGIPCQSLLDMGDHYILVIDWQYREALTAFMK